MSPPEIKSLRLKCRHFAWGVGAERAAQLARLEFLRLKICLLHRPSVAKTAAISEKFPNSPKTSRYRTRKNCRARLKRFRGGGKSVFEIILDDGSARLHCAGGICRSWKYFAMGDEVFVFGKLKETAAHDGSSRTEVIEGGEESFIHINRIAPIYPLTEGLPQRWLRGLIWRTLEKFVAAPRRARQIFRME